MRKLSPRFKAWLFNRQHNEERRRKRGRSLRAVNVYGPGGAIACYAPRKVVPLPRVFCLEQNRDEVVTFLDSLRSRFARQTRARALPRRGGRVRTIGNYFDFTKIEEITPAAALVLAAEYDRARMRVLVSAMIRAAHAGKELDLNAYRLSLIDLNHWAPQVVHSLGQLGFFELLDIDEFVPAVPEHDEHILPFVSGDNVDGETIGELIGKLKDLLDKLAVPNEGTTIHLHGRIVDAIQNVRDHAYPSGITWQYPPVGRWWAAASVDTTENRLDLIVYDQGVTIPGSIPHSRRGPLITAALRKMVGIDETLNDPMYDGVAIKAAIEAGKTGTAQPHRGKGLMFMRDLVTHCTRGELRILSRNGSYLYQSDGAEDAKAHDMSIGGTLIEWRLYL